MHLQGEYSIIIAVFEETWVNALQKAIFNMDSLEVKVQLAPFVVNTIQKTKWLYRLRDRVLEILSLPVTIALILKIFSFCGCQEQFYIIDWARKVTGVEVILFWNPPQIFSFTLPQTTKAPPLGNSAKLCYIPWKFHSEKQRSLEIPHDFFLVFSGHPCSAINTI